MVEHPWESHNLELTALQRMAAHSQMPDPLVGREGVQFQVCAENNERDEIHSNTTELSPQGQTAKTALKIKKGPHRNAQDTHLSPTVRQEALATEMHR